MLRPQQFIKSTRLQTWTINDVSSPVLRVSMSSIWMPTKRNSKHSKQVKQAAANRSALTEAIATDIISTLHCASPGSERFPTLHAAQFPNLFGTYPLLHCLQLPLSSLGIRPAGQIMHSLEPALAYSPTLQAEQFPNLSGT